jgi:hypothetical protein
VVETRRSRLRASLRVLGAGVGWGALTGAATAALVVLLGSDDVGPADVPEAVGLGMLLGAPTGAVLGLALALLPALGVVFARTPRVARWAATIAYVPVAVVMVAAQFNDGWEGQEEYASVFVAAASFGLWRCQRTAGLALGRVTRERAEPSPSATLPLAAPST